MRITLEIPEAEYKRYKQYYEPYIVSEEIQKTEETNHEDKLNKN